MVNHNDQISFKDVVCYHGNVARPDACKLLELNGDFLLRTSPKQQNALVLTLKSPAGPKHHIINYDPKKGYKLVDRNFRSVRELLDFYVISADEISGGQCLVRAIRSKPVEESISYGASCNDVFTGAATLGLGEGEASRSSPSSRRNSRSPARPTADFNNGISTNGTSVGGRAAATAGLVAGARRMRVSDSSDDDNSGAHSGINDKEHEDAMKEHKLTAMKLMESARKEAGHGSANDDAVGVGAFASAAAAVAASSNAKLTSGGASSVDLVKKESIFVRPDDLLSKQRHKFGYVCTGVLNKGTPTCKEVAIRIFRPEFVLNFKTEGLMKSAQKHMSNPNLLSVYGLSTSRLDMSYVVTEKMSDRDLRQFLQLNRHVLDKADLAEMAVEIAGGMAYLEACGVTNRLLEAGTVLIDAETSSIKLSTWYLGLMSGAVQEEIDETMMRDKPSLARFRAPESLLNRQFSTKSDVYSFGVLLWEMFSNRSMMPYEGKNIQEIRASVIAGDTLPIPTGTPAEIVSLMKSCWHPEPNARPSFNQIRRRLSPLVSEGYFGNGEEAGMH
eukprot:Nk52_evm37s266 gene=Nk52_evmTU37s266